jgi:hypothetical protein
MPRKMKTVQQSGDKYQRGVTNAGPDYTAGIQNGSSWVEGATAASGRRNSGLQQAIADGRIDRGIARKGDAGWRAAALAKGPQNYTQSVARARPAYEAGMGKAMQYQQAAQAATANIDTSTPAGRLQKMMTWVETVRQQSEAAKANG